MIIHNFQQRSEDWYNYKVARIGGTRFGQVISGKKNRLVYDLVNEKLNGYPELDDYIDDDMQFGIDNEPIAADLYEINSELKLIEIGLIQSIKNDIHIASPDRIANDSSVVVEIKCTRNGAIHLERFFDGVDSKYLPQIKNYFAVSDKVKEVHWVSYCPYRLERPLVIHIFKREMFEKDYSKWSEQINAIEKDVKDKMNAFIL